MAEEMRLDRFLWFTHIAKKRDWAQALATSGHLRIDGRVVWDRLKIEAAFSDLPDDKAANPLDRMLGVR